MVDSGHSSAMRADILRIVLVYAVFASLWILLSDLVTAKLFADGTALQVAQTLKGWFFVAITSLLLYFLLRRLTRHAGHSGAAHAGLVGWKRWQLYLFAFAVTLAAFFTRQGIAVSYGERPLLILFMFPIILSAAIGGLGPGLLATLLAVLAEIYFAIPPIGSFSIAQSHDLLQLGFLAVDGLLVSFISAMLHQARYNSEQEKQSAEASLAEKTRALHLLDAIAEGSTDAIYAKDTEGRYLFANHALLKFAGKSRQDVLGRDDTNLLPLDQARKIMGIDRSIVADGHNETVEYEATTISGKRRFLTTKGPLLDEAGRIAGVFGIARDISEIRAVESALRRERDLNQRYLDTVQSIMVALDSEGRISMITAYGCELLGYRESELLGENWFRKCLPEPDASETLFPIFRRLLAGDLTDTLHENAVLCRDGSLRMISWRNMYLKNEIGNIIGTLSSGEDVTERRKSEESLRESEATYRSLFDHMLNGFAFCRMLYADGQPDDFVYLGVNEAFEAQTGLKDVVGRKVSEVIPGIREADSELFNIYGRVARGGEPERFETFVKALDMWFEISVYSPKADHFVAVFDVITDRKKSEEQLRKLSLAVEQSPENIVITDIDARIEYVNESFVRNSGYSRAELIGQNPRIHHSGKTPQSAYDRLWESLTQGRVWEGEFINKRKDGSEYTVHAVISPIRQPDGRITHFVAVEEDVTEKKLAEAEIYRLAFHDPLTGLPNRTLLLERTAQALATISRVGEHSALISFNIDRFKTINDAGGQTLGDALLRAVAERLTKILHEGDVVARIAGDEFAILLTDLAAEQQTAAHLAMHVSSKIHGGMLAPFIVDGEHIALSACMGIALFPGKNEDSPLDILRRANTALHHAKSRGNRQSAFFESALDEMAKQRFDIERELHQAIENGELRVFLQPQVEAGGKIVGAEALVRWQHPQRGLVPPGAFIPIAEESNLIIEIGNWVFTEVCRLLAREELTALPVRVAVNISPRHFRQPDFVDQIQRVLASTGADPNHLTLEVTEGMLIDNINDVIARMNELSAMGIHFSLDDFGTGYSSLSYLKRLPIHELKIDRSFIQDLTVDPEDDALVETILAVARLMQVRVVAEGVETNEQAAFLNQRGQVIHQGYLFGRPDHAETMIAHIIKNTA